jgi:hypothetical protein
MFQCQAEGIAMMNGASVLVLFVGEYPITDLRKYCVLFFSSVKGQICTFPF